MIFDVDLVVAAARVLVPPYCAVVGRSFRHLLTDLHARHTPPDRIREMAVQLEHDYGRRCARDALQCLGHEGSAPIPRGQSGEPLWPDGFTGSITHKGAVALAVVTHRYCAKGLGVDIEVKEHLEADVWPGILTPREIQSLNKVTSPGHVANLIFSAKEAFFKAQFPLTRIWLEYQEVVVEVDPSGDAFSVECTHPDGGALACRGRLIDHEDFVLTLVELV